MDIEKIAEKLQLQLVSKTGKENIYICPFCSTSHKAYPKLYINRIKGVFICHHCHLEGSVTDLWAKRCGVDTKTAYKQMLELVPQSIQKQEIIEPPEPEINPEHRNKVYSALFNMLSLNQKHYSDLIRRGLSDNEAYKRFKSLPEDAKTRWKICREWHQKYNLNGVPGFIEKESKKGTKYWDCVRSGMLIPIANRYGMITGFQIRNDFEPKYTWFSFTGQLKSSALEIPGKGIPWIIEGTLKAYITHAFLGVPCIGIAGTNTWKKIPLDGVRGGRIVIAYDNEDNGYTLDARNKLVGWLEGQGITPIIAGWNRKLGKGIDDACLSLQQQGITPTPGYFMPALIGGNYEDQKKYA